MEIIVTHEVTNNESCSSANDLKFEIKHCVEILLKEKSLIINNNIIIILLLIIKLFSFNNISTQCLISKKVVHTHVNCL